MAYILILNEAEERYIPRVFKDRQNPLEVMTDTECVQRFRFDRNGIVYLCALLNQDLQRPTKRSHSIPVVTQVCAALRFFAQGAFYRVTGDTIGICNASLSTVIHAVADALSSRVRQFVKFPKTAQELTETKQGFYALKEFPNVIGAIDGTHVEIIAPIIDVEADYVNRKGKHSINVQAVANSSLEFTNVVARYPGRTHDSFIWTNSGLKTYLDNSNNGYLLGDAGYPLETNLMTPIGTPLTEGHRKYNKSHCKTRNVIERAFGVLKMRFRCLDSTAGKLMFRPERACKVIIACFILHNICKKFNFYGFEIEEVNEEQEIINFNQNENNITAQNIRANIITNYFI